MGEHSTSGCVWIVALITKIPKNHIIFFFYQIEQKEKTKVYPKHNSHIGISQAMADMFVMCGNLEYDQPPKGRVKTRANTAQTHGPPHSV